MQNDFDPKINEDAYVEALKNRKTLSQEVREVIVKKGEEELKNAFNELKQRRIQFNTLMEKEKSDWFEEVIQKAVPLWIARQVIVKNRGWLLRLFGVTFDRLPFFSNGKKSPFEIAELRKRGKLIAIKLFKWDDGEHLEGRI